MNSYASLTFAPVLITDVFVPHKGRRLTSASRKPGETPFVGGSELHNSITGFSRVDPLFPAGWLTLTYNGSVGHARFQSAPFFASDDVIVLEPPRQASPVALLLCASIITRECVSKYSYGSKLNLSRLARQTAMFPVRFDRDSQMVIDWEGMERVGSELFAGVRSSVFEACTLENATQIASHDLPELSFQPMALIDVPNVQNGIFRAYKGKRIVAAHRRPGDTPFIAGSRANNSIVDFAAVPPMFPAGWLTLIYNGDGGTGHCKYQAVPFAASDDVIALEPLADEAAEPALLMMATLISHQCIPKFGFGYKLTLHRLGRQKVMVPAVQSIDGGLRVDWAGMHEYGTILRARSEISVAAI